MGTYYILRRDPIFVKPGDPARPAPRMQNAQNEKIVAALITGRQKFVFLFGVVA
jgi:hypothetical protein